MWRFYFSVNSFVNKSPEMCVTRSISPPASSLLLGLGLNTVALDCVLLVVECSVCRRVIDYDYHTRPILRQSTVSWWSQRARFFSQVG